MDITFAPYRPQPILHGHLAMGGAGADGERLEANSRYLTRGGKPFIPVMGEYHFSRDSRQNWRRELAKIKAGGVSVVATYMFWLYHEEIEGQWDFSGDLDVRAFLAECAAQGLEVLLRIGPWAHGECRNGGFPDWLQNSGIPLRCNDARYMAKARDWYEHLYAQVQGMLYKDGGPIIGVQIENEYTWDAGHILALKQLAREVGFDVPLYTATGWNNQYGARMPVDEVLPVFSAYVDHPWDDTLEELPPAYHYAFSTLRNETAQWLTDPMACDTDGWRLPYERYPFAICEMGCGLQPTHHRRPIVSGMDAYALSLVKLGCGNNLIGYYMYHGGTNRIGQLSTFQESKATGYPNDLPILNYDFGTCLGQYGDARAQYGLLNMLHLFAQDFGALLAPMEHVPAEPFVPVGDTQHLRCCLRTDGHSGFVFVNHYQRHTALADVRGAVLHAGDVAFPPVDVCGPVSFFFPFRLALGGAELRWATAQPLCRAGDTFYFAAVEGIPARYRLCGADGETLEKEAAPGLESAFCFADVRIVTLTPAQARYLRRLGGEVLLGDGCDLYLDEGRIQAIEDGNFAYYRFAGGRFVRTEVRRPFVPASLTLAPAEPPFAPLYPEELHYGGPRRCRWYRLEVSGAQGFVEIGGEYDTAQIYNADGTAMLADCFWTGQPWRVPAALLAGGPCWLVESEQRGDFYREPGSSGRKG